MKMQDSDRDKELADFFFEMKENDRKIEVSEFSIKRKWPFRHLIPFGIAACLLLGFYLTKSEKEEYTLDTDIVIISLIEDENKDQQFIIETKSSIDVWEAPTSSLLTEF